MGDGYQLQLLYSQEVMKNAGIINCNCKYKRAFDFFLLFGPHQKNIELPQKIIGLIEGYAEYKCRILHKGQNGAYCLRSYSKFDG